MAKLLFLKMIFLASLLNVVKGYVASDFKEALKSRKTDEVERMINYFNIDVRLVVLYWNTERSRSDKYTVLHTAVDYSRIELNLILLLLDKGAAYVINNRTLLQKTPLHLALINEHHKKKSNMGDDELYTVVEVLIEAGADPKATDGERRNALHMVMREDVTRLLISHEVDVNARDVYGYTPSHIAVMSNRPDVLRVLIEVGNADLNIADNDGNIPVFMDCNIFRSEEIVKLLAKHNFINAKNSSGDTPMLKSLKMYSHQIEELPDYYRWFVEAGAADINEKDDKGDTVLHIAVREHNTVLAKYFICKNADVKAVNTDGNTPLMVFLKDSENEYYDDIFRALISREAEIDHIIGNGDTILHLMVYRNRPSRVNELLIFGANPDVLNADGETPLLWLMKNKWEAATIGCKTLIFKNLIEWSANVNAADLEGHTPLYYAKAQSRTSFSLLEFGKKVPWSVIEIMKCNGAKLENEIMIRVY